MFKETINIRTLAIFSILFCMFTGPVHPQDNTLDFPLLAARTEGYLNRLVALHGAPDVKINRMFEQASGFASEGKWLRTAEALERIVALQPSSHAVWYRLAVAWRNYRSSAQPTLYAAYGAYKRATSKDEKAHSLLLLGQVMFDHKRAAPDLENGTELELLSNNLIDIYKQIALLVPGSTEPKTAKSSASQHLTVAQNDEEVDLNSAAYCLTFSEEIDPEQHPLNKYIGIEDRSGQPLSSILSFSLTKNKVCVQGLSHGRTYSISASTNLKSITGKTLKEKWSKKAVTISNSPRRIDFQAGTYVLPRSSSGSISLTTVNAGKIRLSLFRVEDRNIAHLIATKKFNSFMSWGNLVELTTASGVQIWSGKLDLADKELNRKAKTLIPVRKILNVRQSLIDEFKDSHGRISKPTIIDGIVGEIIFDRVDALRLKRSNKLAGIYVLIAYSSKNGRDLIQELNSGTLAADIKPPLDASVAWDPYEYDNRKARYAVQWFVDTDIGITQFKNYHKFYIIARSLSTGEALKDAEVRLLTRNNSVLERAKTNKDGVAEFQGNVARGSNANALSTVTVEVSAKDGEHSDDFAFLETGAGVFDLSDYKVSGRHPRFPFDAFVEPERGAYRPGETGHAVILLRNTKGQAPEHIPPLRVYLRLANGDRIPVNTPKWQLGGGLAEFKVPLQATDGTAKLIITLGDTDKILGDRNIEISQFRPDKVRINLFESDTSFEATKDGLAKLEIKIQTQHLYGYRNTESNRNSVSVDDPASNLTLESTVAIIPGDTPFQGCYSGFSFGDYDKNGSGISTRHKERQSNVGDANGIIETRISIQLPKIDMETSPPLVGHVGLTLYGERGRLTTRKLILPVNLKKPWLGIKRISSHGDQSPSFEIISLDRNNKFRKNARVNVTLYKIESDFIWHEESSRWQFKATEKRTFIDRKMDIVLDDEFEGNLDINTTNCARDSFKFLVEEKLDLGHYVIEVTEPDKLRTTMSFIIGSSDENGLASTPEAMTITAKNGSGEKDFKPGDVMNIRLSASFSGQALVAIVHDEILAWYPLTVGDDGGEIAITIKPEWAGKRLYAIASLFKAAKNSSSIPEPVRAMGSFYFSVESEHSRAIAGLEIVAPTRIDPSKELLITVRHQEEIDPAGPKMYVTVFAVDEGLISLTEYPTADPVGYFHGRKGLGYDIHDSYGRILYDKAGGSDDSALLAWVPRSNYLSDHIVSKTIGPVEITGRETEIRLPAMEFDGTVRIVAVAWSKNKIGADEAYTLVRGGIVADAILPKFATYGDRFTIPVRLKKYLGGENKYRVTLSTGGRMDIIDGSSHELTLKQGQSKQVNFNVNVLEKEFGGGNSDIVLKVARIDDGNQTVSLRTWTMPMRSAHQAKVRLLVSDDFAVEPEGKSLEIVYDQFRKAIEGEFVENTVRITGEFTTSQVPLITANSLVSASPNITNFRTNLKLQIWDGLLSLAEPKSPKRRAKLQKLVNVITEQIDDVREDGVLQTQNYEIENELYDTKIPVEITALAVDFLSRAKLAGLRVGNEFLAEAGSRLKDDFNSFGYDSSKCSELRIYNALMLVRLNQLTYNHLDLIESKCTKLLQNPVNLAMFLSTAHKFGDVSLANKLQVKLVNIFTGSVSEETTITDANLEVATSSITAQQILSTAKRPEATVQLAAVLRETNVPDELNDAAEKAALMSLHTAKPGLLHLAWLARWSIDKNTAKNTAISAKLEPASLVGSSKNHILKIKPFDIATLKQGIRVTNMGGSKIRASFVIRGQPIDPESPTNSAYDVSRRFYDQDGELISKSGNDPKAMSGDLVYVVIEGHLKPKPLRTYTTALPPIDHGAPEPKDGPAPALILMEDLLPAGFEIVDLDILSGKQNTGSLVPNSIGRGLGKILNIQKRDDRVIAVLSPKRHNKGTGFLFAYAVRATIPGRFVIPPTRVEAWHDPTLSGLGTSGILEIQPHSD